MTVPFIDIHSHHNSDSDTLTIISHYQLTSDLPQDLTGPISVGLHPWYLPQTWKEGKNLLEKWLSHPQVVALGECGLDRLRGPELSLQLEFLENQILLFLESHYTVLFIHCVKAYGELIGLLKRYESELKEKAVILHDFNCSEGEFQQLQKLSFISFSLGQNFLRPQSKIHRYLEQIPQDRIFFESDDSDTSVSEVYGHCSEELGQSLDELKDQVYLNFKRLFPTLSSC